MSSDASKVKTEADVESDMIALADLLGAKRYPVAIRRNHSCLDANPAIFSLSLQSLRICDKSGILYGKVACDAQTNLNSHNYRDYVFVLIGTCLKRDKECHQKNSVSQHFGNPFHRCQN